MCKTFIFFGDIEHVSSSILCAKLFKYDGIGLVSNKCSIVLNSNSKYLVTRKHDKVVIGKL